MSNDSKKLAFNSVESLGSVAILMDSFAGWYIPETGAEGRQKTDKNRLMMRKGIERTFMEAELFQK